MSYDVPRCQRQILAEETHVSYVKLAVDLSPKLKLLCLKVEDYASFLFRPGQWVNLIAPIYNKPTGCCIITTPKLFHDRKGIVDVTVEKSLSIASEFIFKRCVLGDPILLKVEGKYFVFDYPLRDSTQSWPDLLLVAGGLGIVQVISILRYCMEWNQANVSRNLPPLTNISLLASADAPENLLFRDQIQSYMSEQDKLLYPYFRVEYFLTGFAHVPASANISKQTWKRRICPDDLLRNLAKFSQLDNVLCYISGPGHMMDALYPCLARSLTPGRVNHEDWSPRPAMRESTLCL